MMANELAIGWASAWGPKFLIPILVATTSWTRCAFMASTGVVFSLASVYDVPGQQNELRGGPLLFNPGRVQTEKQNWQTPAALVGAHATWGDPFNGF